MKLYDEISIVVFQMSIPGCIVLVHGNPTSRESIASIARAVYTFSDMRPLVALMVHGATDPMDTSIPKWLYAMPERAIISSGPAHNFLEGYKRNSIIIELDGTPCEPEALVRAYDTMTTTTTPAYNIKMTRTYKTHT